MSQSPTFPSLAGERAQPVACLAVSPSLAYAAMRLLDRYLLRELMVPLFYCLSGFLLFWLSFDLFTSLSDFQSRHLTVHDVIDYYLIKMPELLGTIAPVALLLALLYTLTNHARHHELTAIRSAGISLWRASLPYFATGLVFSLGMFALNELVVADGNEAAENVLNRATVARDPLLSWKQVVNFRNAKGGRIWNITAFNPATGELKNPQIEWLLPDGSTVQFIARQGIRSNDCWVFYDVQKLVYPSSYERKSANAEVLTDFRRAGERSFTNVMVLPELTETPEDIKVQLKFNRMSSIEAAKRPQLSIREILYLRSQGSLNERDKALLRTQLHARIAAPWTCLVVVAIALPFGALSGRRNVFIGVASSISICFAFFVMTRFGLALGSGGYMPAWLAAWFPNITFGGLGLLLTQRFK
ncbi:MAG: putative permease YjgP/YjgQ family protein [Verrucomicrobiales bacterium]|nr:putative permease YjgP/YjgQ family protein [Verrucomicrobiales bacterium]